MRMESLSVCLVVCHALAGLAVQSRPCRADPAPRPLPPQVAAELGPVAATFPGLAVAAGRDGRVEWAQGFGSADLELGVPVTPRTRFLVYSAAKAWTAVAAARLAERGALGPEAPIGTLLPGLPEPLRAVTPMQLALHRAGVRHYADEAEAISSRHCTTVDEALSIFVHDPLLFAPGSDEAYSSWGYVLLDAVLERAAGVPFAELLAREVFAPAGMESATLADPVAVVLDRASAYTRRDGAWQNLSSLDVTCKWGAGGYLATPVDLARFHLALMAGELVSPPFQRLILRTAADGRFRFGGASPGGRSFVLADPAAGWVVALAANAHGEDVDLGPVAERVAAGLGWVGAAGGGGERRP